MTQPYLLYHILQLLMYTEHMQITPYANINEILELLLASHRRILGTKLVGFYLYGSLVIGDFDPDISDIDLVAALSSRSRTSTIANISPGEPFHMRESSGEWLSDWYLVRERGVTLFGPPPQEIIEPISKDEFIHTIKAHARAWGEWVNDMHTRGGQAYAILTMCRAYYTCKNGEQVSKKQAALWAQQELPDWSQLIQNALMWRKDWRIEQEDHEATLAETKRFVDFVRERIAAC
jgi:Domain of unknown function (DUF4111)/Nucleotidyltransferase domain